MKNLIEKKLLPLILYSIVLLTVLSCDQNLSFSGPFFLSKQKSSNKTTESSFMPATTFLKKYRTTEYGVKTDDYVEVVAVDPNGKYVLAGSSRNNLFFERRNSDFSSDSTFGAGGKVIIDVGTNSYDYIKSMAIQDDGKIIGVGYTNANGSYDGLLIRLNTDGSLDTTFGSSGKVFIDIGSYTYEEIRSIIIQSDGKILAAGYTSANGSDDALLIRLNSNGSFDTGFGTGGKVVTDIGTNSTDSVTSMVLQSDDKIVIGGSSYTTGFNDIFLLRFNSDGTSDTAYGTSGKVVLDVGTNTDDYLISMALQESDDKIVIGGSTDINGSSDILLARYNTNGTLDTTNFGVAGKVVQDIGTNTSDYLNSIILQTDGKVVVTGYVYSSSSDSLMVRFNGDGTLDTSYGTSGKVVLDFGAGDSDSLKSLVLQTDGKIIAAGTVYSNGSDDTLITRFAINGGLDTSFGTSGKVVFNTGTNSRDYFNSNIIQDDGKIVAGGVTNINGSNDVLLVRYNADGSIDSAFGTSGKVYLDIGSSSDDSILSIAIQSDGKILAGGLTNANGSDDILLIRFNSDGSLDSSFGTAGILTLDIGSSSGDYLKSIALQEDDKIVIAGYMTNSSYDALLIRLNSDGSFDTSFGTSGKVILDIGTNTYDTFKSVVIQDDEQILVAGESSANGSSDGFVARFNTNGSFDGTFGTGGKVLLDIGTHSYDYFLSIALQTDGKIVATGVTDVNGSDDALLVRLNANGTLDSSFGTSGITVFDFGASSTDYTSSFVIQNDGKIVVSGSTSVAGYTDAILIGFNSDGSLDTTFGTSGKVSITFVTNYSDEFNSISLRSDGKIVVSGYTDSDKEYALLVCMEKNGVF